MVWKGVTPKFAVSLRTKLPASSFRQKLKSLSFKNPLPKSHFNFCKLRTDPFA